MKIILIALLGILYGTCEAQRPAWHTNAHLLFEKKCAGCHGSDGAKGKWGAKDLRRSTLTEAACFDVISNGKHLMPAWKNKLSTAEIKELIRYIQHFRK